MLEEINQLKPTHSHCISSEDIPFINTLVNKCVRGVSTSLKSSMTALFCRLGLTGRTKATRLKNINSMGVIGSWNSRAKWWNSTQKQDGCNYNGQQISNSYQSRLTGNATKETKIKKKKKKLECHI